MIVDLIPEFVKYEIRKPYLRANLSYSQEGEDLILNRVLDGKKSGFYVDIGAHHPFRFSNTFSFYERGWRGINIDAMPGSMKLFDELRPDDINVELGVGLTKTTSTFYIFNEPAVNTFSKIEAEKKDRLNNYSLIDEKIIEIEPIESILDQYLPKEQTIDFMSIDVEGKDLEVLQSNNWEKYRPKYILVEELQRVSLGEMLSSELYRYMTDLNYQLIAKSYNTLFFVAL